MSDTQSIKTINDGKLKRLLLNGTATSVRCLHNAAYIDLFATTLLRNEIPYISKGIGKVLGLDYQHGINKDVFVGTLATVGVIVGSGELADVLDRMYEKHYHEKTMLDGLSIGKPALP